MQRTSDLARQLKPYVLRWIGEGRITVPGQADYVIEVEGAACRAVNGRNGVVAFSGSNHAAVIQAAINAAGIGGVLIFRPGTYWIGTQLQPLARQSWHLPFAAVFRPTGDNRIIYAELIDWWQVYGTLHIEDTDRNSRTVEAIYLNGVAACYFQHILIWDYYKGVTFTGEARRSFENVFENLYMAIIRHQGLAIWAEVGDNYFNNVFIKGPSTTEWATGQGLVIGLFPSQGTIFGGIMFGRVEVLDCNVNVDLQGLYEVWIDQLLSDNAFFAALYIGDHVQRLFVGTIWAAGSGEGIWIQGSPQSSARRLRINQAFCWVNAVNGIHFNGWVEGVSIGSLYLLENQIAQLRFSRGKNKNISIDNLTIVDSNKIAIDAGGIDAVSDNVSVAHADIDDGECMGLDLLRHIDGTRDGKLFANRGVVYIPAGQSSVVVPHGLENRPLHIHLTPHHADARQAYISAIDPTHFTIDAGMNVSAPARVAWAARTGVEISLERLANPDINGNPPAHWTAADGAFVETVDVYNGAAALRINSSFATWRADAFAAVPFGRYRIWGYVKGTGNQFAELTIRFWSGAGGSGTLLQESALPLTSLFDYASGYVRVQGDFSAPAGTQSADLLFRNTAGDSTDVYGDDFEFRQAGGANLLANPSVESGGSAPDNWTLAGASWTSGPARSGSRSLRMTHSAARKQATARWVNVSPNVTYEAAAWLLGQASGNVALVVQWYSDAGGIGNLIREDVEYFRGTFGIWARVAASFTAPPTAQSAYFIWRMEGWTAYDLRGDAFGVRQLI